MLTINRDAVVLSCEQALNKEFRAARWVHHRLLDFEDLHQRLIDAAAEAAAPGILRVGRILSRLIRRADRRERTSAGSWSPNPHPKLAELLKARLGELREKRNADPRWVAACRWARGRVGVPEPLLEELLAALHEEVKALNEGAVDYPPPFATAVALDWSGEEAGEPKKVRRRRAKDPSKVRRKKGESDEKWAKRFALLTTDETDEHFKKKQEEAGHTRREAYRNRLYKLRRCYWGTWNALCKSVDQALKDVLERRKQGLPAEWHRPQANDPETISTDHRGLRVVERSALWWTVEVRVGVGGSEGHEQEPEEWAILRAKCGNWHKVPKEAKFKTSKLTRRPNGAKQKYSLNLTVEGVKKTLVGATAGRVSFDWGHREHGHDTANEGLRAFVWRGDDGRTGEILIPTACRTALDEIDTLKARVDKIFNARKTARGLTDRNRYTYRRRLERSGVCTEEESDWLRWEMRYERQIMKRRKRFQNLRREVYINGWTDSSGTYHAGVRDLRKHYSEFVFEGERTHDAKTPREKRGTTIRELQTEDVMARRKRANRDLTARYEFVSLCERFGAALITVPSRNTTRECPTCGHLGENGPELLTACPECGTTRDKDRGAAEVILRRAKEVLEDHAAE